MAFYKAIVVNNKDPENQQRVQVRIMGVHSFNRAEVPDSTLPWAKPVNPISEGKVDGGYGKFDVPEIGDWVFVIYEYEDTILHLKTPYYTGIIRTKKDIDSEYQQTVNSVFKDRWDNKKIVDAEHTNWHNGKETVDINVKEDGNIKIYSANKNKAIIDIGGDLGRSSAVNYTNLDKWMTRVEEILTFLLNMMQGHVHTGNMGYPTLPAVATPEDSAFMVQLIKDLTSLQTEVKLRHIQSESKKIQISSFEDSQ
jgi:hypothetical protein